MNNLLDLTHNRVSTNGKAHKSPKINYLDPAAGASNSAWLRACAWQIGEKRAADAFAPADNHVGLAHVSPYQAFAHWRIRQNWIDESSRRRGPAWTDCRLILRLYDVSCIEFNGLNAHQMQDHVLPSICGHLFIKLAKPGTWQLAEVGFVKRHVADVERRSVLASSLDMGGDDVAAVELPLRIRAGVDDRRGAEPASEFQVHERPVQRHGRCAVDGRDVIEPGRRQLAKKLIGIARVRDVAVRGHSR